MNKCHYVPRKEAIKIRKEIWEVLRKTNKGLKGQTFDDFKYSGFINRIVGSSKRNMIFRYTENELYDTDIQIEFLGKKAKDFPTNFKHIFNKELSKHLPKNWTSKISTSVLTINKIEIKNGESILVHQFDLALIRNNDGKREINKGKVMDESSEMNFCWNIMKDFNDAYTKWKSANTKQINEIKDSYKEKRCKRHEEDLSKDDPSYQSSSSLFIMSVNEKIQ